MGPRFRRISSAEAEVEWMAKAERTLGRLPKIFLFRTSSNRFLSDCHRGSRFSTSVEKKLPDLLVLVVQFEGENLTQTRPFTRSVGIAKTPMVSNLEEWK